MRKCVTAALTLALLSVGACSSQTYSYDPPSPIDVPSEAIREASFDDVWAAYVEALTTGNMVIQQIDKQGRSLLVSFNAQTPSDYVDCGTFGVKPNFPVTDDPERVFVASDVSAYAVPKAGLATYGTITVPKYRSVNVVRETSLAGTAEIRFIPDGPSTRVQADVLYEWTAVLSSVTSAGSTSQTPSTASFSSSQVSEPTYNGLLLIECRSNGELEAHLLELVGP